MVLLSRSVNTIYLLMHFLLSNLTCIPGVPPSWDFLNTVGHGALLDSVCYISFWTFISILFCNVGCNTFGELSVIGYLFNIGSM